MREIINLFSVKSLEVDAVWWMNGFPLLFYSKKGGTIFTYIYIFSCRKRRPYATPSRRL